jgi:1-acyl-sn-glycerol-3-phosphate acyltransferase
VLLNTFHGHIPFFKFFLKRQLFKIPITRHAWWALDYPSWTVIPRSFIEKTPI